VRRGPITQAGNAHLRHIVVETAWSYQLRPRMGPRLRKRQEDALAEIEEIARKAQIRLTSPTPDCLQHGRIDRAPNLDGYFTPQALANVSSSPDYPDGKVEQDLIAIAE